MPRLNLFFGWCLRGYAGLRWRRGRREKLGGDGHQEDGDLRAPFELAERTRESPMEGCEIARFRTWESVLGGPGDTWDFLFGRAWDATDAHGFAGAEDHFQARAAAMKDHRPRAALILETRPGSVPAPFFDRGRETPGLRLAKVETVGAYVAVKVADLHGAGLDGHLEDLPGRKSSWGVFPGIAARRTGRGAATVILGRQDRRLGAPTTAVHRPRGPTRQLTHHTEQTEDEKKGENGEDSRVHGAGL